MTLLNPVQVLDRAYSRAGRFKPRFKYQLLNILDSMYPDKAKKHKRMNFDQLYAIYNSIHDRKDKQCQLVAR